MEKRLFQLSDLPYGQFQQLGIDEMQVKRMFTLEDIERLLDGKMSGLKSNILLKSQSSYIKIDAKFLLKRNKSSPIDLMIFSRQASFESDNILNDTQLEILKKGGVVVVQEKGTTNKWWLQLDLTVNRLFRATENYIKSLPQKNLTSNHKYTDADYYDWEYAVYKLENINNKSDKTDTGTTDLKEMLKKIQEESHALASSIFDGFDE